MFINNLHFTCRLNGELSKYGVVRFFSEAKRVDPNNQGFVFFLFVFVSQVVTTASRHFHEPLSDQNQIFLVLIQDRGRKEQMSFTGHMQRLLDLPGAKKEISTHVRKTGAKYSVLLQLPYYDAVRFVIIDPMHNLFFGSAKTTLKVWKEKELLTDKHLDLLQRRVSC